MHWNPPVDLSAVEAKLCQKLQRVGRLYRFLRKVRSQLFNDDFQTQLIGAYSDSHTGTEPVAPAQVTVLLLLQGYAKVSDDEAIRRAQMDDAWKMVLDTLGTDESPVCKGTLQNMRNRLIATGLDQALLARTVALARTTGLFGAKALKGLRVAIDSAPLEGAGRVEDTINLIGHALRNVVHAIAEAQGCDDVATVARAAGAPVVAGTSIKAALDLDWDADDAVQQALDVLLAQAAAVRAYVATQPDVVRYAGEVHDALELLARVIAQDTEPVPPPPPPKVTLPSVSPALSPTGGASCAPPSIHAPSASASCVPPNAAASASPSAEPTAVATSPASTGAAPGDLPSTAPPAMASTAPSTAAPNAAASASPSAGPAAAATSPASTGAVPSVPSSSAPPAMASTAPSASRAPSTAAPPSGRRIMQGVANDRLISLADLEMRHGRKSSTQRIDGYKRYAASDLDDGLILSVVVQPANVAEHRGADGMRGDLERYGPLDELHIDRAFLASELVRDTEQAGGQVVAKPYPEQTHYGYSKRDFAIDLANGQVTCPAGKVAPIAGELARFRASDCVPCPQRAQCQKPNARDPRAIHISPQEALFQKLIQRRATPEGRATTRQRTAIEHVLAHAVFRQGDRARYFGAQKNEYDLRRTGVIFNLQAIDRAQRRAASA